MLVVLLAALSDARVVQLDETGARSDVPGPQLLPALLPLLGEADALQVQPLAPQRVHRSGAPTMGILDGLKDAFKGEDGPPVAADRVTPFDRWLGNDKALLESEQPAANIAYIDPADAANYYTVELAKPMGIAFVENDGGSGGIYVDEILADGSAAQAAQLLSGDQLVAVGPSLVLGSSFDEAIGEIKDSAGDKVKLVFYRGPTQFLYGPTQPSREWYTETFLQ